MRLSHLGDVVRALPVYHAVRAARPRAEIAWVVQAEFAGLIEGLAGLSEIFFFGRRAGARAWPRLWSDLRAFSPDWTIDAQGNTKSALVTLGSLAPRRSGMHRSDWTERFGASVLTDHAAPAGVGAHALDRIAALVEHVAPGASLRTDCDLAAHEIVEGRALCARIFPDARARPAILHLAPPSDVRSWPLARFEELARALADGGRAVLVLSGPAEAAHGRELARRLPTSPRLRHWVGQRGLRTLAALFRAVAEREGEIVVCDSGPAHLAAASGLRVVCLEGPQDETRTGPWPVVRAGAAPSPHAVVRAHAPPACAPCFSRRCRHPEGPVCMGSIRSADVAAALR